MARHEFPAGSTPRAWALSGCNVYTMPMAGTGGGLVQAIVAGRHRHTRRRQVRPPAPRRCVAAGTGHGSIARPGPWPADPLSARHPAHPGQPRRSPRPVTLAAEPMPSLEPGRGPDAGRTPRAGPSPVEDPGRGPDPRGDPGRGDEVGRLPLPSFTAILAGPGTVGRGGSASSWRSASHELQTAAEPEPPLRISTCSATHPGLEQIRGHLSSRSGPGAPQLELSDLVADLVSLARDGRRTAGGAGRPPRRGDLDRSSPTSTTAARDGRLPQTSNPTLDRGTRRMGSRAVANLLDDAVAWTPADGDIASRCGTAGCA